MIITVTSKIPQEVTVSPSALKPTPTFSVPVPLTAELGFVAIPGPPGPEGPPGLPGTIVHVGPTPPSSPNVNDLWVDTS